MVDSSEVSVDSVQPELKQQDKEDRATYANRNSRLRIAKIIEEAPSTPKHPYVSIIRGREIESVETFASGVIDILRLHGNVIIETRNAEEIEKSRKTRSTDVVYVISQADIEKAVKASSRSYPLSSAQILNIINISIEGNSRAIFKVTTDFSKNIISPASPEKSDQRTKSPTHNEDNHSMFGMATTTIGTYFGATAFFSIAGLNVAIFYFLAYLGNSTLSSDIFSLILPVSLSLTALSLLIRLGGLQAYVKSERIAFTGTVILFAISYFLYFGYIPGPTFSSIEFLPVIIRQTYYEEFFVIYSAVMSVQIGLFAYNRRRPLFGIVAGLLSGGFSAWYFSFFISNALSILQGFGFGFFRSDGIPIGIPFQSLLIFYLTVGGFNVATGVIFLLSGKYWFKEKKIKESSLAATTS